MFDKKGAIQLFIAIVVSFYIFLLMLSSPSAETWSVDRKYVNADSTYNYVLRDHKGDLQLLTDSNYDLKPSKPVIRVCSEVWIGNRTYNCIFFTAP